MSAAQACLAATPADQRGKVVIDVSGGDKKVAPDGYQGLTYDGARTERT